jgi:hypothetical protein
MKVERPRRRSGPGRSGWGQLVSRSAWQQLDHISASLPSCSLPLHALHPAYRITESTGLEFLATVAD